MCNLLGYRLQTSTEKKTTVPPVERFRILAFHENRIKTKRKGQEQNDNKGKNNNDSNNNNNNYISYNNKDSNGKKEKRAWEQRTKLHV